MWMRNHHGRPVGEGDVAEIFAIAFANGSTYRNAISGFSSTGINPYNPNIFSDDDFAGSEVSDRPNPENIVQPSTSASSDTNASTLVMATSSAGSLQTDSNLQPSTSISVQSGSSLTASTSSSVDLGETEEVRLSFSSLISVPKSDRGIGKEQQGRKRKAAVAVLVTSSPFKKILQEKEVLRQEMLSAMQERKRKRQEELAENIKNNGEKGVRATSRPRGRKTKLDGTNNNRPTAIADEMVPLIKVNSAGLQKKNVKCAAKRKGKKAVKLNERQTVNVAQHENEKCECVVCRHIFGDLNDPLKDEEWVQCVSCLVGWQHVSCGETRGVFDEDQGFLCQDCV